VSGSNTCDLSGAKTTKKEKKYGRRFGVGFTRVEAVREHREKASCRFSHLL